MTATPALVQRLQKMRVDARLSDRLRLLLLWLRPPTKAPPSYLAGDAVGAFATIWNEQSFHQARALFERVLRCATAVDAQLYLYWGTLLGHVREGRMLPWDDDIDLALFQPGKLEVLEAALIGEGLRIHKHRDIENFWLKVFDPTYPMTSGTARYGWTYPFIDIFVYAVDETKNDFVYTCEGMERSVRIFPTADILPGRRVLFEGQYCREPQSPMALLDGQYPGWRTVEESPTWDHIHEVAHQAIRHRNIVTDLRGRKTVTRS
jgi:LicD family